MSNSIHPTALVSEGAKIGDNSVIGAFAIIESGVTVGRGCKIAAQTQILGNTIIGDDVEIYGGAIIGSQAEVKSYTPDGTERVEIGARTLIREFSTINAGHHPHGGVTRIGEDCYLMTRAHIAHDCRIGDRVIFANTAIAGGHVDIGDDVWVGAGAMIHQFQKIGNQSILGGGAVVVADIPPFCTGVGNPIKLAGLNTRGLKRRNFTKAQIQAIRQAYRMLFESAAGSLATRIEDVETAYPDDPHIEALLAFLRLERKRPLATAR